MSSKGEAMELAMYLYSVFLNAYETNSTLEDRNREVMVKFPEFKTKLDELINKYSK
jgi:hypothetical protein